MAKKTETPTKSGIVSIDFSDVPEGGGGNFRRVTQGDYALKVTKATTKKGKESGLPNILVTFKLIDGPKGGKGKLLDHNFSLQKQSLWNLRNFFDACGKTPNKSAFKMDVAKMVGWECAGTIVDDEYNNKPKSSISAFFPKDELGDVNESADEVEETEEEEAEDKETEEEEEEMFT